MVETVSVSMDDDLADKLRQRKERTGVPVSVYVRQKIEEGLNEEEEEWAKYKTSTDSSKNPEKPLEKPTRQKKNIRGAAKRPAQHTSRRPAAPTFSLLRGEH